MRMISGNHSFATGSSVLFQQCEIHASEEQKIAHAAVQQISPELEEAPRTSGANWFEYFRRILLPLLKPTMVSVAIIVFISAARDIPTVIFLSTHETRTLSLLMLDHIADANQEKAAVLGVFVVFLILALLLIGRLLGFRRPSVY